MKGRIVATITATFMFLIFSSCEERKVKNSEIIKQMITFRTLGLANLEESKLKEAELEFQNLIRIAEREALAYANLGLVYMRMGKLDKAEEQLNVALEIEPYHPDIRLILTEVYLLSNREEDAQAILEGTLTETPDHAKTLYYLGEMYSKSMDREETSRGELHLRKLVSVLPGNIPSRIQLIEILIRNHRTDQAIWQMEELRQQIPELSEEASEFFNQSLDLLQASNTEEAFTPSRIFHNLLKPTPLYRSGIIKLKGPGGALRGFPILNFSQDVYMEMEKGSDWVDRIQFFDVTASTGFQLVNKTGTSPSSLTDRMSTLAPGDIDGDGDPDLYVAFKLSHQNTSNRFLFRNDSGVFVDITSEAGIEHEGEDIAAIFSDYDNSGNLDLFIVNSISNLLYQNDGQNKFYDVSEKAGISGSSTGLAACFADYDQEGDLDLFIASKANNYLYRNNLDGTFTEISEKMGVAGEKNPSRDAAFGDFDDDGDIDIFVVNETAGNRLYTSLRQGFFRDVTEQSGIGHTEGGGAVAVGDYNNDGFLDLFVTALVDGNHSLFRNRGDGTFEKETASGDLYEILHNIAGLDVLFFDFDNDGFLDLLIVGKSLDTEGNNRGVLLFHNDGTGRFMDSSSLLPPDLFSANHAAVSDYDGDGDLDIFITGFDGGIRLLRNDGGNVNHYLKIKLVGLTTGSGKNNYFGIGNKLEIRAGDLYQMRVVTDPVSHFGLGSFERADIVRVVWTNGVPQNRFRPLSDQSIVEKQILKGSCPWLYAWNGKEYEFVTDVLWRSALGMPLGIMGGETTYAFPNSTDEYHRIPGESNLSRKGTYSLQFTNELWETPYIDEIKLVVIDHPDSVDVYIDESFSPPPFPSLQFFPVNKKNPPLSVTDDRGNDLLPQVIKKDGKYISNLRPTRYQGLMEKHDLIIDLGNVSGKSTVNLYLLGWVFPTDASINVSMSQAENIKTVSPYLQVPDKNGQWKTVIENLGFPKGKNKMVIAELSGKFLSDDYRVRIRTSMQIYWDYIFYSTDEMEIPIRKTTLYPFSANLHYRGFSRVSRKSPYSPHIPDYNSVDTDPRWRDLTGFYTRYGDVQPLLLKSDDLYVILNSGDEITLQFDATQAPDLENGWSRDYLFYNNGWLKDGDLNTASGQTVFPLPFHSMSRYPYGENEFYPKDKTHQEYIETYNTREVTVEHFRWR